MRYGRPLFPFAEVRLLQRILVAHDIAFDGKVSDINLDLARDYQTVFCLGPLKLVIHCQSISGFFLSNLRVQVLKLINRWVKEGRYGECFLHRALDEAIW